VKQRIVDMAMHASGIRDTARVLPINRALHQPLRI
jgi:transposase-like protein